MASRVVIIQRYLTQYRVEFYESLREMLAALGVELVLAHGHPLGQELRKSDAVELPWSTPLKNKSLRVGKKDLLWQPAFRAAAAADLVIVEHATRLVSNYVLATMASMRTRRFALWGHGANLRKGRVSSIDDGLRRWLVRMSTWYFAYNDFSANLVVDLGFPVDRVTSVNNAVDTRGIRALRRTMTPDDRRRVRALWGVKGENVGIMVSGLYAEKRLSFLIESTVLLRDYIPDFSLLIVGGGPEEQVAIAASERYDFVRYLGPKFAAEKSELLVASDVYLMPGLVGLGVLDAFAAGLPVVTIAADYHSPEFHYLEAEKNALILESTAEPKDYASMVSKLILDLPRRREMSLQCIADSETYSVEEMAFRFCAGIEAALGAAPRWR